MRAARYAQGFVNTACTVGDGSPEVILLEINRQE